MSYITIYYNGLIIMSGEKKAMLKKLNKLSELYQTFDMNKIRIKDEKL